MNQMGSVTHPRVMWRTTIGLAFVERPPHLTSPSRGEGHFCVCFEERFKIFDEAGGVEEGEVWAVWLEVVFEVGEGGFVVG